MCPGTAGYEPFFSASEQTRQTGKGLLSMILLLFTLPCPAQLLALEAVPRTHNLPINNSVGW